MSVRLGVCPWVGGAFVALPVLAVVALPGIALATQTLPLPGNEGHKITVVTAGEYRLQIGGGNALPVDAAGTTLDQRVVLDQRLRARFDLKLDFVTLGTEWDLAAGQLAGQPWGIPGSIDARNRHLVATADGPSALRFLPRRAAIGFDFPVASLEFGLVTGDWGLGMLANSGARDPFFGRSDFGDRVIRGRATFRPLLMNAKTRAGARAAALNISAAVDYVVEDDTSATRDGQQTMQGIGSVLWFEPDHCRHGVYLVYRHQKEPDATTTDALVIDLLLDQWISLGSGWRMRFAGEGAVISGRTNRATTWNAQDDVALFSGALVGQTTVSSPVGGFQAHLRAGWASGDGDPDDGVASDFTFDRDFDVGMVLFDELLGGVDAQAYNLITDPERTDHPPAGVDALATEGAARRVGYLQPIVGGKPLQILDLRAGLLLAWSSGPIRHPFYGFRAGGAERNHHDETVAGRYLGTELDWSVGLSIPLKGELLNAPPDAPRVEVQIQGGHAFLSKNLRRADRTDPGIAHRVLAAARLRW